MGIILMLLASASFATMAAMIKAIGPDLPLTQLVFLRCALAVPILLAILIVQGRPIVVQARKLLVWRTVLGILAVHCFFYALTHMELASCIFIGRAQPLILALLAPLLINEKAPRAAWLAIITGLAGVALILNPAAEWSLAALVAFGGATFSAGVHLIIRRLNRTDHPQVIVFNFTMLTGLVTGLWSLPGFASLSLQQWLLIAGVALFASLGQILMTSAYRHDRAPAVAAASYSSVILSVVYGYFFWGETPNPLAWLGGALIITGGVLLVKSRHGVSEPAVVNKNNLRQEVRL
ncbi:MAG: DMT family transporter [Thermodesulfobacteriota bacterium]